MALALREIQASDDEQDLVSAVRGGDDRAFEHLFSRYRKRITGYVYALVGDYGRAEDITQEVFISALRRLRETERSIAFKPWLYEIARNACIDEFRRTRRATVVPLDDEQAERGLYGTALSNSSSPEARWEVGQQLRNLFGAFFGLSDNHHQILVLRELEGLSYAEIAERMGMSRPVVESTLFRARRRLSQEYEELDSGRRCRDVRAAVDDPHVRGLARLGLRERRRIASHLDHCHDCLRYARMAGVDDAALRAPGLARKVAALLPFGWWPLAIRRGRDALSGRHGGAAAAVRTAHRASVMADGGTPGIALGRAIAAAAALIVLGSGLPGAGARRPAAPALPRVQPARTALSAPAQAPRAHAKRMRTAARGLGSAVAPPQAQRRAVRRRSRGLRRGTPSRASSQRTGTAVKPGAGSLISIPAVLGGTVPVLPQAPGVPVAPGLPAPPSLPAAPSLPGASPPLAAIDDPADALSTPVSPPAGQDGGQTGGITGAATAGTQDAVGQAPQQAPPQPSTGN